MTRDLENLGCFQHKTLLLKFPTEQQVPHQFLKDFVRGYIDGDGSITTGGKNSPLRLRVCGTRELLEGLKIYFNTILAPDSISNKLEKRHKDTKNNYALSLGSARKSLLILHELYDGASVFLDRKNDLYLLKKRSYSRAYQKWWVFDPLNCLGRSKSPVRYSVRMKNAWARMRRKQKKEQGWHMGKP